MPGADKQIANLYWTVAAAIATIAAMRSLSAAPIAAAAALTALVWATPARAEALSAADAQTAVARGALLWDVRQAPAALIPGAVLAVPDYVQRWLQGQGTPWLERAVSAAGIDLSRDVIVYGVAGDARAQALHDGLARLASGRVSWLVGGIDEWQAAGLPTTAQAAQRPPVPQRLVARPTPGETQAEMAAPGLRRSEPLTPALAINKTDPRG